MATKKVEYSKEFISKTQSKSEWPIGERDSHTVFYQDINKADKELREKINDKFNLYGERPILGFDGQQQYTFGFHQSIQEQKNPKKKHSL